MQVVEHTHYDIRDLTEAEMWVIKDALKQYTPIDDIRGGTRRRILNVLAKH